jgi:hypothetical protein
LIAANDTDPDQSSNIHCDLAEELIGPNSEHFLVPIKSLAEQGILITDERKITLNIHHEEKAKTFHVSSLDRNFMSKKVLKVQKVKKVQQKSNEIKRQPPKNNSFGICALDSTHCAVLGPAHQSDNFCTFGMISFFSTFKTLFWTFLNILCTYLDIIRLFRPFITFLVCIV